MRRAAGIIWEVTFTLDAGDHRIIGGPDGVGTLTAHCTCDAWWRNGFVDHPQMVSEIRAHGMRHSIRSVA